MTDTRYTIEWAGWNNSGTHDKVWGWLKTNEDRFYVFWGRRGKTFQAKEHHGSRLVVSDLVRYKRLKGYNTVEPIEYENLLESCVDNLLGESIRVAEPVRGEAFIQGCHWLTDEENEVSFYPARPWAGERMEIIWHHGGEVVERQQYEIEEARELYRELVLEYGFVVKNN
jgi:hypothetical protein